MGQHMTPTLRLLTPPPGPMASQKGPRMARLPLFVLLALLLAAPAGAQVVPNPTKVEYTPSADHALLTKYVLGYFLPTALEPFQSNDLPIVAPDGTSGKITQPLPNLQAVPIGSRCVGKLKAVAGVAESDWSLASNEFTRTPGSTGPPIIKK